MTRDLPGIALVITFHDTFHKKEIEFLHECTLLQILKYDCKNIATMVKHKMVKMPLNVLYIWDYFSK